VIDIDVLYLESSLRTSRKSVAC